VTCGVVVLTGAGSTVPVGAEQLPDDEVGVSGPAVVGGISVLPGTSEEAPVLLAPLTPVFEEVVERPSELEEVPDLLAVPAVALQPTVSARPTTVANNAVPASRRGTSSLPVMAVRRTPGRTGCNRPRMGSPNHPPE
jgi:hypothetical protein